MTTEPTKTTLRSTLSAGLSDTEVVADATAKALVRQAIALMQAAKIAAAKVCECLGISVEEETLKAEEAPRRDVPAQAAQVFRDILTRVRLASEKDRSALSAGRILADIEALCERALGN